MEQKLRAQQFDWFCRIACDLGDLTLLVEELSFSLADLEYIERDVRTRKNVRGRVALPGRLRPAPDPA